MTFTTFVFNDKGLIVSASENNEFVFLFRWGEARPVLRYYGKIVPIEDFPEESKLASIECEKIRKELLKQ